MSTENSSSIDSSSLDEMTNQSTSLASLDAQAILAQIQGSEGTGIADDVMASPLDGEFDGLLADCEEAAQSLYSIRDFIRFCVTQLRNYEVVVAQGTNDVFAEAAAIVLHTLSLDWSADEQILDCRLTPSEKGEVLALLQSRIVYRKPLSYLVNLAYFCDLPFYVDERVLIPRSPIAELIRQQFYPYFETNGVAQPLGGLYPRLTFFLSTWS